MGCSAPPASPPPLWRDLRPLFQQPTCICRCVLSHPDETWPLLEKELWTLWFAHLWDNIPSVRRNTAVALGNAVRSYGLKALQRVEPVVR